jgi:lysophospholipase L1-like esterase
MRTRLVRIVALVLINVTLIALLEVASYSILRKFHPKQAYHYPSAKTANLFHAYLGYVHPPNTWMRSESPGDTTVSFIETDAEGNSITPPAFDSPQIRLAVTGGSTMFGHSASSNETTVPSLIEKLIYQKLGVRAEVTNLGKQAYASFQEMLLLDRYLASHSVDLVLTISGFNDAHHAMNYPDPEFGFLPPQIWNDVVPLQRRAERGEVFVVNWVDRLRSISHIFDLFYVLENQYEKGATRPNSGSNSLQKTELLQNLPERVRLSLVHYSLMDRIARARGAQFAMLLQPTARVLPPGKPLTDDILKQSTPPERRRLIYYNAYFEGLRAAQKDFVFYDISGLLSNEVTSLYTDRVHYTDQGATVVAEAVVDRIKPLIEKKLYEKPRTVDARQPLKESLCRERNGRPTFNAQ